MFFKTENTFQKPFKYSLVISRQWWDVGKNIGCRKFLSFLVTIVISSSQLQKKKS